MSDKDLEDINEVGSKDDLDDLSERAPAQEDLEPING